MATINRLKQQNIDATGANNDTLPTVLTPPAVAKGSIPSVLDDMMPRTKKKTRKPLTEFETSKE